LLRELALEMNGAIEKIHNHSPDELAALVLEAWPGLEEPPQLECLSRSGFSNINIHARAGDLRFVLKLPLRSSLYSDNPYRSLYRIAAYVSQYGLGPGPLMTARLRDENRTPFIAFEFIDGMTPTAAYDFTHEQATLFSQGLKTLAGLKPPETRSCETARDYVEWQFSRTANLPPIGTAGSLLSKFVALQDDVLIAADRAEEWSGQFMHGDLHEGNIVFSEDGIVFLDFEECAHGEPLLDLAYLRVQRLPSNPADFIPRIVGLREEAVKPYEPLALTFAISWTIQHLQYLESGLVDKSLAGNYTVSSMRSYAEAKIEELRGYLS
jgi:aminoglycoside phosphotransferase (APT) family kinase protein